MRAGVLAGLAILVGCSAPADTVRSQRSPDGKYLAVVYVERDPVLGTCVQCVDITRPDRVRLPWRWPACSAGQPWFDCDAPVEIDWTGPREVTAVGTPTLVPPQVDL